jgi:3-(3-hydroxy-phenyl)propionate hydroxylase
MEAEIPRFADVMIVGCGPVGATLALMLGKRGVSTLVIDKAPDIFMAPRAIAFDFDALRILQSAGIDGTHFDQVKIPFVRMICPMFGEFARINTAREVDTHPMQITFYQPDLERVLRNRLHETPGVTVQLATELVSMTQDSDGVTARIKSANGQFAEIRTQYLVGTDGASSSVRAMIGQEFKGQSFVEDWLIIDARNPAQPIDHIEFLCDPKRPTPHMVAPGGRQRWEFMLAKGESRQKMESDAEIERLLAPWGGLNAMEIERRAVYRFHARTAANFRNGRVFLAGDAAHITPPFVGQGLVSGLRDAANLSWKLAKVLQGKTGPHVLDSYDLERRPHSQAMINIARLMGKLIMPRSRVSAFLSHGTIKLFRSVPRLRALLEDQEMRPANGYRKGLFLRSRSRGWPRPGHMLPQFWLTDIYGMAHRSDDVMGSDFTLVGFDTDLSAELTADTRQMLQSLGANIISIAMTDRPATKALPYRQRDDGAKALGKKPAIALVRPDRIVMAVSHTKGVDEMLRSALGQLSHKPL